MKKRILSLVLTLALLCTMLPGMLLRSSAEGELSFLDERGMPVEISASNKTIFERTHGWPVDENGNYDENGAYYEYSFNNVLQRILCKYADGSEDYYSIFEFSTNAYDDVWLEYSPAGTEWKIGENVVTITLCADNGKKVSCEVVVTIREMNIVSVECENRRVIEHTNGSWITEEYDYDTWEYVPLDTPYYRYWNDYYDLVFVLEYKDGTIETGSYDELGLSYEDIDVEDDQSSKHPWTVGNTYQCSGTCCGLPFSYETTIVESPLESIEITEQFELIENWDGYWSDGYWDDETQTYVEERYYDYTNALLLQARSALTLHFRDGRVKPYSYDDEELRAYEREYNCLFECVEKQKGAVDVGDTLTIKVNYLGQECTATAKIVEGPVASVSWPEEIHILEGTCGYWTFDEDNMPSYYYTDLDNAQASAHVVFRDGTEKDLLFSEQGFAFTVPKQPVPYGEGKKMTVLASYMGVEAELTVIIDPSPIVSLEIEPVIRWKDLDLVSYIGRDLQTWKEYGGYEVNDYEFFRLTVTLRDGSVLRGSLYDIIETVAGKQKYFTSDCWSDQSSTNHWGPGKHTAQMGLFGHVYSYEVSVIECPVASISAKDLVIAENTHVDYLWSFDEATGKEYQDKTKPYYDLEDVAQITVKLTDGSSFTGSVAEVEKKFCHYLYVDTGEVYFDYNTGELIYHPWSIGEHTATVSMGAGERYDLFSAGFKVTITASSVTTFSDVKAADWFYAAVNFAVENGLMNGVGNNKFAPNDPMTRAMLVTVLHRYEGAPKQGENIFNDVPDGQWYTDAVAWAAANKIVGGVGNGKFDPNGNITREQMATILYRYAQGKGFDTSKRGDLSGFPDAGKVSDWAKDAIVWAVGEGIINGSDGKLLPQGNATRAQVATILMRFIEKFA